MSDQRFRYAIEVFRANGECAGQVPASVDWEPALQATWLKGLRQNRLQLTDGVDSSAIYPLWSEQSGNPYVDGFRVTILSEHSAGITEDFTTAYFRDVMNAALSQLRREGRLEKDERVRILTLATFNEGHAQAGPTRRLKSRELPSELTLKSSSLAGFVDSSTPVDDPSVETGADDIPVVIPRIVLDEARDLTWRAGARETGGILIGHLCRDTDLQDLFVEVTAQIPAAHAPAKSDRLTFTPETWTAAQAAVDLRASDEVQVGVWHSHPVFDWCRKCPEKKKRVCPLARGFMSADDCQLFRAIFPKAYTSALVVSNIKEKEDVVHKLFGWRGGLIVSRGYYLLNGGNQ